MAKPTTPTTSEGKRKFRFTPRRLALLFISILFVGLIASAVIVVAANILWEEYYFADCKDSFFEEPFLYYGETWAPDHARSLLLSIPGHCLYVEILGANGLILQYPDHIDAAVSVTGENQTIYVVARGYDGFTNTTRINVDYKFLSTRYDVVDAYWLNNSTVRTTIRYFRSGTPENATYDADLNHITWVPQSAENPNHIWLNRTRQMINVSCAPHQLDNYYNEEVAAYLTQSTVRGPPT